VTVRREIPRPDAAVGHARTRLLTEHASETEALGRRLAERLRAGDVVLVAGDLGAGKTTLIRGAARALGVTVAVTSPSFTIGQRYPGRLPVSHIDLYRLEGLSDEEPELLDDYIGSETITFIEWPPARLSELPGIRRIACRVQIQHAGQNRRLVEIS
jgi:tRNA threonylcarbamoyladenosine biosynthesis protein TsaE